MKVLALTTRARLGAAAMHDYRREMGLGPDAVVDLVCVRPLRGGLPVRRLDAVDPSVVPFRPIVPVSGPGVGQWGGWRKSCTRALRAARRVTSRVPLPAAVRRSERDYLAVAAATSPELRARAAAADVVVALDDRAALAAWHLARRVQGPAVVNGAEHVRSVLERLGRPLPPAAAADTTPQATASVRTPMPDPTPGLLERPYGVLIAPGNYAGQGHAWARALRENCPDVASMSVRVGSQRTAFPTDYLVDIDVFNGDLEWRLEWREFVQKHFSHVIVEANLPVLGSGLVRNGVRNTLELQRAGRTVALLSHGSDARVPSIHAEREQWHSYGALRPGFLQRLERQARANVDVYNAFEGTVFVSTPGVRAFVPRGVWLPVVVEPERWDRGAPIMERKVPVVAHLPSSTQKGSHLIDPILSAMAERGDIEYLRISGIPHERMAEVVNQADLVVEQFGIADYSVVACEAMAAGRVVVSRVAADVRDTVKQETGLELPIVEANPETLEQVVLDLIHDVDRAVEIGRAGTAYVRAVHDGRRSAEVLRQWVTSSTGAEG